MRSGSPDVAGIRLDSLEALANAAAGLVVSIAAVRFLRAAGVWETMPATGVAIIFFGLSYARSRFLRWWFRRMEQADSAA